MQALTKETLGDFVRRVRTEGRWSREDVAQRAKRAGHQISQSYVQQIEEHDIKSPSVEKVTALAVGLGISPDLLIGIVLGTPSSAFEAGIAAGDIGGTRVAAPTDSSIHLPELEHLNAAQRARVETAAREAAREEIKKLRGTSNAADVATLAGELPDGVTVAELKYFAAMPRELWEGTELDPRSGSALWQVPPGVDRLNELKMTAEALGFGVGNSKGKKSAREAHS